MTNYRVVCFIVFIGYVFILIQMVDYVRFEGKGDLLSYELNASKGAEYYDKYDNLEISYLAYVKVFFNRSLGLLNSIVLFDLFKVISIIVFSLTYWGFLKKVNPSYLSLFCFCVVILHPRVFHLFISNYRTGIPLALILFLLSYKASRIYLLILSFVSLLHTATLFLMLFALSERIMRNKFHPHVLRFGLILCFIGLFSFLVLTGRISGESWNTNMMYAISTLILFTVYITCSVLSQSPNDNLFLLFSHACGFAFVSCILLNISGVRFFGIFLLISSFAITDWSRDARSLYLVTVTAHCIFANYYYFS